MARPSPNKAGGNAGRSGLAGKGKAALLSHPVGKGKRMRVDALSQEPDDLFQNTGTGRNASPPDPSEETESAHPPRSLAHGTVPKSLVKFLVGVFLIPVAWVMTRTFFQSFTTSIHHGLLASQSFGCFAGGMILFVVFYLIIPRNVLMLPYVFGHELTHALWVKLFGGRVADQFHVSEEGGHVLTDRVNTWIALAPYFFPIYSLLTITLYGAACLVTDMSPYRWILFLLLGLTMAFHLVFTFLLITKGQPDLHYGGTFFSLMVIYLINLTIITGLLLVTGKEISLSSFIADFVKNTGEFLEFSRSAVAWILEWVGNIRAGFGHS